MIFLFNFLAPELSRKKILKQQPLVLHLGG